MHFLTSTDYINKYLSNKKLMNKTLFFSPKINISQFHGQRLLGGRPEVVGRRPPAPGTEAQFMLPGDESKVLKWECFCQVYLCTPSKTPKCLPRDVKTNNQHFKGPRRSGTVCLCTSQRTFPYSLSFTYMSHSASET